jgi:hypothetical protein
VATLWRAYGFSLVFTLFRLSLSVWYGLPFAFVVPGIPTL